jgi:hypothetical protein
LNAVALIIALLVIVAGVRLYQDVALQDWLGDTATAIVRPVVGHVLNLVNAPPFTYIASALIVLSALLVCFLFWRRRIQPARRDLAAISARINGMQLVGLAGTLRWPEIAAQIGSTLAPNRMLLAAWVNYAAPDGRLGEGSFADAAEREVARRERDENGMMAALPGYYTSIGLILTFIGLVVALYFAARGFRSGNIDEARQSIIQLLNASAFKFLTSVAALASALLISLAARSMLSGLRRQTWQTAIAVDELVARWRTMNGGLAPALDANSVLLQAVERLSAEVGRLTQAVDRMGAPRPRD